MRFLQLSVVQGCAASWGPCCLGGSGPIALPCASKSAPPLCISSLLTSFICFGISFRQV